MLEEFSFDAKAAADYAARWALSRNPAYYDFDGIGGDCTNFVSQCLYAGSGVMNYTPDVGWYYNSLSDRAAAWSGVEYLHRFLISNRSEGPFAAEISLGAARMGDIIQLGSADGVFYHTCIAIRGNGRNVRIAAHTNDALDIPLTYYSYGRVRCLRILGVKKYT